MHSTAVQRREDGPRLFRFTAKSAFWLAVWVAGLLAAGLFTGVEVTEKDQRLYNEGMRKAEMLRDVELEEDVYLARGRLHEAKTWSWWFGFDSAQGEVVDRRRRELAPLQRKLDLINHDRDDLMRAARQQVGVWSEYGVGAVRQHFWANMEMAKAGAKRQTYFDAFFMIIFDRDSTFGEIVMRLFVQFFLNLVLYSVVGFFTFMFSVYSIISLFAPSAIEGFAFFVVVGVAAVSVIAAFFAVVVGGVVGVTYGGALMLKNQARQRRLEQERRQR